MLYAIIQVKQWTRKDVCEVLKRILSDAGSQMRPAVEDFKASGLYPNLEIHFCFAHKLSNLTGNVLTNFR